MLRQGHYDSNTITFCSAEYAKQRHNPLVLQLLFFLFLAGLLLIILILGQAQLKARFSDLALGPVWENDEEYKLGT